MYTQGQLMVRRKWVRKRKETDIKIRVSLFGYVYTFISSSPLPSYPQSYSSLPVSVSTFPHEHFVPTLGQHSRFVPHHVLILLFDSNIWYWFMTLWKGSKAITLCFHLNMKFQIRANQRNVLYDVKFTKVPTTKLATIFMLLYAHYPYLVRYFLFSYGTSSTKFLLF